MAVTREFVWYDLMSLDPEAAKKFYAALFEWEVELTPLANGDTYEMLKVGDTPFGGLMKFENAPEGVPSHWIAYVSVEDCDASYAKVGELGGAPCVEPFAIPEVGKIAIFSDPTGGTLSLFSAEDWSKMPKPTQGTPGAPCWNELNTTDAVKAGEFYKGLFGWQIHDHQMDDGKVYHMFGDGQGMMYGGMWQMGENEAPRSTWLTYFAVENCHAMRERAASLGAQVILEYVPVAGMGAFSLLAATDGSVFALWEQAGEAGNID